MKSRLKDIDSAELAFRLRAAAYGLLVMGMCMGGAFIIAGWTGASPVLGLVGGLAAGIVVYFVSLYISERSGRIAASVYGTSGSSTPAPREYSQAESLVARGRYDEAAAAYALLSEEFPDDPEPRIRQARVLRDKLSAYEAAAASYKTTLTLPTLKRETELVVLRELVELFTHKLREPTRALPYLARIAEKHAGTPTGEWARAETKEIKQTMQAGS